MNTLAFLSNLAGPDGFLILFFVLIFFGAKRLPELARSMGLAVREFQKAKEEFTTQLTTVPTLNPKATPQCEAQPAMASAAPVVQAEKTAEGVHV